MSKDRTNKKKYKKPVVLPLGELAVSMGSGCNAGSHAIGSCNNGPSASAACGNGGVADASCLNGGDPKTACNPGSSPGTGCNTGCVLSGLTGQCLTGSDGCPI